MDGGIGRRDLIKLTAGAALASQSRAAGAHKFLTAEEYALVDELTELIIPADEKSGGARAAKVAEFIDATLAEAFEQSERDAWRANLARVNALARELQGNDFMKCTPAGRIAVLTRMARNEMEPKAPEELFFRDVKALTIRGYYTSKIGIHDEMGYLGNTLQQGDYAGELPVPKA
jgi:hypothetical protein